MTAPLSDVVTVGANYTYTHRDLDDPTNAAFRPTDVPTHKAFAYVEWRPLPGLRLVPGLDLASDRWTVTSTGARYYRTGAYALAAARIEYQVGEGVQIGAGIRNLFDDLYALVDGFPEPGRSYYLTLTARR